MPFVSNSYHLESRKMLLPPLLILSLFLHSTGGARIEDLLADFPDNQPPPPPLPALNLSSLVWQPLRASFRPLNRQPAPEPAPEFFASSPTPPPLPNFDDEDQPTRMPLNRFRPTRAPSVDPPSEPVSSQNANPTASGGNQQSGNSSILAGSPSAAPTGSRTISDECFECICEASTNCNSKSRCQTSDVRHTRCGLFLINYDQWLEAGLSQELVTSEMLARDPAADERAFYRCVTDRPCAERLLANYLQKRSLDCDKDGRIDCYDMAAVHHAGPDQCASESFLETQYWSDFNACYGFGR